MTVDTVDTVTMDAMIPEHSRAALMALERSNRESNKPSFPTSFLTSLLSRFNDLYIRPDGICDFK